MHHEFRVRRCDDHFGVLIADHRLEAFENILDAEAELERFDFEGIGFAGFEAGND